MKTFKIINAHELRDVAQQAARDSRAPVKIEFPYATGGQINVLYDDVKDLFNFATSWGVLLWQLDPEKKKALRKQAECTFFCCANCRIIGREHRHKIFINLCSDCGKSVETIQNERTAEFWQRFDERNRPKEDKLPPLISELPPEPPPPPKPKLVNPIKLKHSK